MKTDGRGLMRTRGRRFLENVGLVIEQAVEKDTPKTLDPVEAHRRGSRYARQVFAGFAV